MTREPGLDGLRGVAILMVVVSHVIPRSPESDALGLSGVMLFFVLSGFLITRVLLQDEQRQVRRLRRFYGARAVRLVPALLCCVAVVGIAWRLLGGSGSAYADYAATAVLYVENFFAAAHDQTVLGHTWTLALEEQFYLVWPFVLLVLRRRRRSTVVAVTVALLLASAGIRLVWHEQGLWEQALFALPANAFAMLTGALLALMGPHRIRGARNLLLGAAVVALPTALANRWSDVVYGGPLVTAVGAAILVGAASGPRTMLASRPLRLLGLVSYAWYLWHWPLLFLSGTEHLGLAAAAVAAVALVPAVLSTLFVETPLRRRWRALLDRRDRTAASAAA